MRLKQFLPITALLVVIGFGFSVTASAHVLKSDNGVAAVLHIPPYDAPVANQTEPLQFQFGTTSGSFQINEYDVTVTVLNGDRVIKQLTVVPPYFGANAEGDAKVIFPEPAVYTLKLNGTSDSGAPNFTMTYQLRVTGVAKPQATNGPQILLIGAASMIILAMIAARQIITGKRYVPKPESKPQVKPTIKPRSKQ